MGFARDRCSMHDMTCGIQRDPLSRDTFQARWALQGHARPFPTLCTVRDVITCAVPGQMTANVGPISKYVCAGRPAAFRAGFHFRRCSSCRVPPQVLQLLLFLHDQFIKKVFPPCPRKCMPPGPAKHQGLLLPAL